MYYNIQFTLLEMYRSIHGLQFTCFQNFCSSWETIVLVDSSPPMNSLVIATIKKNQSNDEVFKTADLSLQFLQETPYFPSACMFE